MNSNQGLRNLLPPIRRLRWRLTLYFTLVTLAALLMVLWWAFLGISFFLARENPQDSLAELRSEFFGNLLPEVIPWLPPLILLAIFVSAVFGFITARWLESRLDHLRQATKAWGEGDFKVRVHDENQDEISQFGQQLNQMAAEMESLLHTRQELAALEERNQLARDLHDSVKQQLAAASLQIGAAQAQIERDPVAARQAIQQAKTLTIQAQSELTGIILELRPAALHEKSLAEAIRTYLRQWSQQSGVQSSFSSEVLTSLPVNEELALFRVAQEALANVARHSQASQVDVRLNGGKTIELSIVDNGRGFDPSLVSSRGFGLKSMSDRLTALGGSLEISSRPGEGSRVTARLPVRTPPYGNGEVP